MTGNESSAASVHLKAEIVLNKLSFSVTGEEVALHYLCKIFIADPDDESALSPSSLIERPAQLRKHTAVDHKVTSSDSHIGATKLRAINTKESYPR